MRILVGCHNLSETGGSQSHTQDLFDQAWKSGHEATEAGIDNMPRGWIGLDVALLSHNTRNMSGRFHGYEATPDMIEFCIGMYSSDAGKVNRELAEKHHDIKDKVNQYLEMVQ